jgi:peroxiredoxin
VIKKSQAIGLTLLLAIPLAAQALTLQVGDKAPNFTLPDQNGNQVSLSQFLGKKNVVLAFYVLAFTGG